MMKSLFLLLTVVISSAAEPWEDSIDVHNGMSYIRVAEDITSLGLNSRADKELVEHLYVLAGIVNPKLRESVILGLISVQDDSDFVQLLQAMKGRSTEVLVPSIINEHVLLQQIEPKKINEVCQVLSDIRSGSRISNQKANLLKPWGYLFPDGLEALIARIQNRTRAISKEDINATLKVELAILGGPTLWSADYNMTSGRPVTLSINDDLATIFGVDPTKRLRKNGLWVAQ